jgi:hypothetical protein
MTKIPLPYYGNKMLFSIASNWSFGHLWSPRVDIDKRFSKTYYIPPLQIQSLATEKNLVTIQQSRFFIWQPKVNQISHMATEGEPNFQWIFCHFFGQWELSKNILHAPFPNSVASDRKISITIQQSRFLGWWLKSIFNQHLYGDQIFFNCEQFGDQSFFLITNDCYFQWLLFLVVGDQIFVATCNAQWQLSKNILHAPI